MPPKKQASKKQAPAIDPKSSFTPDNFENELKKLAQQAKTDSTKSVFREQASVYLKAAVLLTLSALFANVSQLTLSPVYGGIPSSLYHNRVVLAACFTGWASNHALGRVLPFRPYLILPLLALYFPVAQFYLFKLSSRLTAHWGPLVTESLTLFPVIAISVAWVATTLENTDFSRLPKWIGEAIPGLGAYGYYQFVENLSGDILQNQIGKSFLQTRLGLQTVLAASFTLMAPSKFLVASVPALLHTALLNTHVVTPLSTSALNNTLSAADWRILDRQESLTGYISILDNDKEGYRVMRCDHSLLGGEWFKMPKPIVAEPIYPVFTMLEAVRLVEVPDKAPDNAAKALNIGLGIGTTPSALVAHGIDTTIVEIDPVVYDYAVKYFGLPSNHTALIEDATKVVSRFATDEEKRFDYIIHDVFTGGAEPIPLFTLEFLQELGSLLKPNGVIAINYAGDFTLPPASIIFRTIQEVFPSCRIFREAEAPSAEEVDADGKDFTNMVIFCTKVSAPLNFRYATDRDFLESRARGLYMMPRWEVPASKFLEGENHGILRQNETARLVRWHEKSALGHWEVMRTVLPPWIWEHW